MTTSKLKIKPKYFFNDLYICNFSHLSFAEKKYIWKMRNDESVRTWMVNDYYVRLVEHFKFINKIKKDKKNYYFLLKQQQEYIGVISINQWDEKNKHAYLGIYKNPFSEKKHLGMLLMKALKYLALNVFLLHTLKLEVIETNKKAISYYRRNGFAEEGILREFLYRNGQWLDMIIMGITVNNIFYTSYDYGV